MISTTVKLSVYNSIFVPINPCGVNCGSDRVFWQTSNVSSTCATNHCRPYPRIWNSRINYVKQAYYKKPRHPYPKHKIRKKYLFRGGMRSVIVL